MTLGILLGLSFVISMVFGFFVGIDFKEIAPLLTALAAFAKSFLLLIALVLLLTAGVVDVFIGSARKAAGPDPSR